jgi:hypothetical protein
MSARDYRLFRSENAQNLTPETGGQFPKARNWRAFLQVSGAPSLSAALPGWRRSADRTRLHANSLLTGNFTGNFAISGLPKPISQQETAAPQSLFAQFPTQINRENISRNREFFAGIREFSERCKRPFLARLFPRGSDAICSRRLIFGWRFKAEPQPPVRKLLYRRRGLSHTLPGPIVAPAARATGGRLARSINAGSSRRRGARAPGLRLYRHAQGHQWPRDAGPGRAAAGPTSSKLCSGMAPAFASSPSGSSTAYSSGRRTSTRVGR